MDGVALIVLTSVGLLFALMTCLFYEHFVTKVIQGYKRATTIDIDPNENNQNIFIRDEIQQSFDRRPGLMRSMAIQRRDLPPENRDWRRKANLERDNLAFQNDVNQRRNVYVI